MDIYAFIPFISGIFSLEAGLYVLIKAGKLSALRRPYFLAAAAVFCYCFMNFGLIQFSGYPDILVPWTKVFSIGAFLIIPALFNLLLFVEAARKGILKYIFSISVIMGLSALLYTFVYMDIRFIYFPWGSCIPIESVPYSIFFLNAVLVLPLALIISLIQRKEVSRTELEKRQLNFIIFAVFFANLAIFFDFLPAFGVNLYHMGSPLLALAFISIVYSIVGYRLLELDLIINKALLIIFFVAPLLILHLVVSTLFFKSSGVLFTTAFSLVIISSILLFTPYKSYMQNLADKLVYQGRYDYQKILQELCQTLISMLDLDQLLESIIHIIAQTIDVDKIVIFLEEEERHNYVIKASFGLNEETKQIVIVRSEDKLVERLKKDNHILVKEELRQFEKIEVVDEVFKKLDLVSAELVAPLFFKERLVGLITLSSKKSKQIYNQGDIDVLNAFAAEASIAIENARLYAEAIIDGLTRIFHHNYFYMRLKEEVARAKRYGHPIALLMMDLDHFKEFNDEHGHQAGDLILRGIGQLLKNKLRTVDIPARYGGEEFAVILPETAVGDAKGPAEIIRKHINDTMLVAERFRESVENFEIKYEGKVLRITISIGVAYFDGVDEKSTAEQLVRHADLALYRAKGEGRNKVIFYQEEHG